MNNNIIFKTNDGKTLYVEFNNKIYSYSIDSISIDASDLIKAVAECEIVEEIKIDDNFIINYNQSNELSTQFNELYNFIKNIPIAYNQAVKQMLNLE